MKITAIHIWKINLPLSHPYWLSGGRLRFDELDSTFIRIDTDAGISGWGEACPWGHTYLPAHGDGVRAAMNVLAPALIGQNPCALDHINRVMDTTLPGHLYAKSALDIACWDILGKKTDMPLWQLLGSNQAQAVAINSSISTGLPQEMVQRIKTAREKGYKTHSAKIGGDDIALDIARIQAIDAALVDGDHVTYDINRAWTPGVAVQILNATNTRGWIEQPCETLTQCADVCHRVQQPIMLDECLHDYEDHLNAWRLRACEGVKLKPNRVGGMTKARRIRDFALTVGWQLHIEDVGGSVLADTVAIHLASSTPTENRLASWLCHAHLACDCAPLQGVRPINGVVTPPSSAGIGVIPEEDFLGQAERIYR